MFRNTGIQQQIQIANDWVRYAEMRWWEPDWFKDKDKIALSEHLKQVLRNLDTALAQNDLNGIWREVDRIRHQTISLDPDELGAGLRRCGQIALQLGQLGVALELFHAAQYEIGTEAHHYFALLNWMEGSVAWVMPSRQHDNGMNRWQESIRLFRMLAQDGIVGGSRFSWYRDQRDIMIATLEFAIEFDRLPAVWEILEKLNIDDPDFTREARRETEPMPSPPPASKKVENWFDLFVVYEEIPAGTPISSGYNPTAGHPVAPGLEPDHHIEVTRVRVDGRDYSLHSIGLRGNNINLAQEVKHFALRVRGNSMNLAGIEDGDLVLCRAQSTAQHNDIAAIAFKLENPFWENEYPELLEQLQMTLGPGGEHPATLKRYIEEDTDIFLRAESSDPDFEKFNIPFPKFLLGTEELLIIYGVAVAVLKPV